jgi:hypothetical protein
MSDPTQTPPKAEQSGVMDDLVEVSISPATVFARSAKRSVGAAFMIVWLALAALAIIARPVITPIMEEQMRQAQVQMAASNPNMTAEQMESARAATEQVGGILGTIGGVVGPPIAILLLGLLIWVVGKVFGGQMTAGQGMLVATFAYVPRIFGAAALALQGFIIDVNTLTNFSQVSIGPARFFDATSTGATVLAVLLRFDVFVIWSTILIAVAYHVVGKMSKGAAYGAAFLLWVLGALPLLMGAMRSGG